MNYGILTPGRLQMLDPRHIELKLGMSRGYLSQVASRIFRYDDADYFVRRVRNSLILFLNIKMPWYVDDYVFTDNNLVLKLIPNEVNFKDYLVVF